MDDIARLQSDGSIEIDGEAFDTDEIQVLQQAREGTEAVSNSLIAVELDCSLNEELIRGGYAREIVNRVQRARKDKGFNVSDRIVTRYDGDPALLTAADEHRDYIMTETLSTTFERDEWIDDSFDTEIDGKAFKFSITVAKFPGKKT